MPQKLQKQSNEISGISKQAIRQTLTNEDGAKNALQALVAELRTLKLGLKFTTDQVAGAISDNPQIMKNITVSLLNSFSFRKKISEEILAYLLEQENKIVQ